VGRIGAIFDLDVVVNVLDFGEIVPVACISVVSSILCSFSDWFYSQPFKPQKVTCLK
jgi:hypothetical protein